MPTPTRPISRRSSRSVGCKGGRRELFGDVEEIEHSDDDRPCLRGLRVADHRGTRRRRRPTRPGACRPRSHPRRRGCDRCPNRVRGCRRCSVWPKSRMCSTTRSGRRSCRVARAVCLAPDRRLTRRGVLRLAARSLGLVRRTLGDLDGAVAALDVAVRQNRRIGHLPMLAIARADLAGHVVRRDGPGDRERARSCTTRRSQPPPSMDMWHARVAMWSESRGGARMGVTREASVIRKRGHWEIHASRRVRDRHRQHRHGLPRDPLIDRFEDVRAADARRHGRGTGAQAVLDARARDAYRSKRRAPTRDRRSRCLRRHRARPARRAEFDALLEELTHVVRPGGRSRAFTDADERARTSVQKALRARSPRSAPTRRTSPSDSCAPSAPAPSAGTTRRTRSRALARPCPARLDHTRAASVRVNRLHGHAGAPTLLSVRDPEEVSRCMQPRRCSRRAPSRAACPPDAARPVLVRG